MVSTSNNSFSLIVIKGYVSLVGPNLVPPTTPAVVTPSFISLTCGQDVVVSTLEGVATLMFQCRVYNGSDFVLQVFKDGVLIGDNFQIKISPASDADFGTYAFSLSTKFCGTTIAVSRILRQGQF